VETAKHRTFIFLDAAVLPDNMLVNIAFDDAFFLGVLSSRVHVTWALAAGGTLEDRPRYNKTRCFDPFPFPVCSEERKQRIRELGEQLDQHRKQRQELYPTLTITGMYNVLEKLKTGEALTDKEREIHERGLVSVLEQIHEDLDREVPAYSWPVTLADEEILERLVVLNHERAEEERRVLVRWLRPEFQAPAAAKPTQAEMTMPEPETVATAPGKRPWPNTLPEQVQVVRSALAVRTGAVEPAEVASAFSPARADQVQMLLETLTALGHARKTPDGRFVQVLLAA
jgi:MmeI, target recognition domain